MKWLLVAMMVLMGCSSDPTGPSEGEPGCYFYIEGQRIEPSWAEYNITVNPYLGDGGIQCYTLYLSYALPEATIEEVVENVDDWNPLVVIDAYEYSYGESFVFEYDFYYAIEGWLEGTGNGLWVIMSETTTSDSMFWSNAFYVTNPPID